MHCAGITRLSWVRTAPTLKQLLASVIIIVSTMCCWVYILTFVSFFSRHEPFLLWPTRTQPEVLSETAADGDRWQPYLFWFTLQSVLRFRKRRVVQQPRPLLLFCPTVWHDSHMLSGGAILIQWFMNLSFLINAMLTFQPTLKRALATAEDETLAEVGANLNRFSLSHHWTRKKR